jgi:hypothetical protein
VAGQDDGKPGGRRGRLRAEALLGSAAEPTEPRIARPPGRAPVAVRRAALVVAVEAVALGAVALLLLWLTVTSDPQSVGRALAEVVYVGLSAALLAAAAVGLWRVSSWARGPVIVLQLLLAVIGYTLAVPAQRPLLGVPVLLLVALEFYLLFRPEARLAFAERPPPR